MKRNYSAHVPVRVPSNWAGEARGMVIQLNDMLDDIYAKINKLRQDVEELKQEDEEDVNEDN
jgi:hypothetical protein